MHWSCEWTPGSSNSISIWVLFIFGDQKFFGHFHLVNEWGKEVLCLVEFTCIQAFQVYNPRLIHGQLGAASSGRPFLLGHRRLLMIVPRMVMAIVVMAGMVVFAVIVASVRAAF